MHRVVVVVAMVVVASGAGWLTAPTPAAAAVAMTVTPSTGLHDGEVVAVHATGLTPGDPYRILQCPPQHACRTTGNQQADAGGDLDLDVVAHAFIRTDGGSNSFFNPSACTDPCTIFVVDAGTNPVASAGISFVPDVTILDPPVIPTPGTGLVDGQVVSLHVAPGYFDLGQSVTFTQCPIPQPVGLPPCNGPRVDAIASKVDGSVTTAFTVHSSLGIGSPTDPPVDCRATTCGAVATGLRYDHLEGPLAFAAATTTTAGPTTSTTLASPAPGAVATPRFTG